MDARRGRERHARLPKPPRNSRRRSGPLGSGSSRGVRRPSRSRSPSSSSGGGATGLGIYLFALWALDWLGLGVLAGVRRARARRARAGGTRLLAALRGNERVGALVERVGPLGGIGIARRLAEGTVRLGRALGHGALLFLTPAVGVAVVLGHGTSFLVTLRRSPAGDRRARAQGATRGAGGRKPSSETKRRGDAPKGAEVGAITQHEHVGRLPHGGLDRLLEHARARLELFPV